MVTLFDCWWLLESRFLDYMFFFVGQKVELLLKKIGEKDDTVHQVSPAVEIFAIFNIQTLCHLV